MATKRRKSVRRRSVRRRRHLGQLAPVAPQPQYIVEESSGSGMIILGLGALAILGIGAVLLLRRAPATATTTSGGTGAGGSSSNAASLSPASLTIPAGNFGPQEVSVNNGVFNSLPYYSGLSISYADTSKTKVNISRTADITPGLKKVSITTVDTIGGFRRDFEYQVTVQ